MTIIFLQFSLLNYFSWTNPNSEKGQHTGEMNPWVLMKMQMAATNKKLQMHMHKPLPLKLSLIY